MKSMGVATGCGCKEVYRFPHTTYLFFFTAVAYMLVGGEISIRDPYICAVHESVPTNRTLSSTGLLSVQ